MNKVIVCGRLTADPELRQSQSGMYTTRFTVAVDRPTRQGAEKQTDFIICTAFNKTAEFISKYFGKGRKILLSGNIKTGSYQDKNHPDVKHYTFEVWVDGAEFADSKPTEPQNAGYQSNTGNYPPANQNAAQGSTAPSAVGQAQQMQLDAYGNIRPTPGQQAVQGMLSHAQAAGVPTGFEDFEPIISDSDLPF